MYRGIQPGTCKEGTCVYDLLERLGRFFYFFFIFLFLILRVRVSALCTFFVLILQFFWVILHTKLHIHVHIYVCSTNSGFVILNVRQGTYLCCSSTACPDSK